MTDPFLDIGAFTEEFQGTLSPGQAATAERLLDVVSDYIRTRRPEIADDDQAAIQVAFEIVSDAITYGPYARLSEFDNGTSKRKEAGKFSEASKLLDDLLTDKHKRMLSIARTAAPRGSFAKCDY
jgi:hypothetical protein